ncbi:sensor histidine kinase [Alkaliphilus hydrothermalis]|uniref:histidine kinase n=1 Tax=Alkaliphilus hydrothermalis TaxID=1482730 RepID=A0ABS2NR93_9FIRM|nr:sensor histidine kinase [Alkaliphilus hydrothermalis]MBM7615351.1 signal transduction histidine kinase [Alkaliphilus hydrothermalis]
MKVLFKGSFIIFVGTQLIMNASVSTIDVIFILLICASSIFRGKYIDTGLTMGIEFVIISMAGFKNPYFFLLLVMLNYDLVYKKYYRLTIAVLLVGIWGVPFQHDFLFIFLFFICGLFAYISQGLESKESDLQRAFDQERRIRYELEGMKARLLASSKEMVHLTEIKERNRIARDIHDNIGHSIAGLLMQLQVVEKLQEKDMNKSKELLKKSIDGLADTLVLLRETVYNIKPKENLGIEYIHRIVKEFCYCSVELDTSGDFSRVSPYHLEILTANLKEALTNITKHSSATEVIIKLQTNDNFSRLFIKDNGIGCQQISENLGLNGMRDRIKNIGGSISISSNDGFLIVCVIPKEREERGKLSEGAYS